MLWQTCKKCLCNLHLSSSAAPRPCPLGDVEVCLHDYNGNAQLVCTKTQPDGTYALPAPYGLSVTVRVALKSHNAFVRTATSRENDATSGPCPRPRSDIKPPG